MSAKSKYRNEVSALYRRAEGIPLGHCAYCASPREVLDHVPPLRLACDLDLAKFRENGGRLLLFPACNDCNALLGNQPLATYGERLSFLYSAYASRVRDPRWSATEIGQLGRGLQAYVASSEARNRELLDKFNCVQQALLEAPEGRHAAD